MTIKPLVLRLMAIGMLSVLPLQSAMTQNLPEAEIEQAVKMMRDAGQSEAQIQQFLNAVQAAQDIELPTGPAQAGSGEVSDIQQVTGMSDAEMAIVGPMAGSIKADQDRQLAAKLQDEIKAFETRYADKPEVLAMVGDQQIKMKLIDCRSGEAYYFEAQGAPTEHNKQGPTVLANRGWDTQNGTWATKLMLRVDEQSYDAPVPTGSYRDGSLSVDGVALARGDSTRKLPFTFEAMCAG